MKKKQRRTVEIKRKISKENKSGINKNSRSSESEIQTKR
jgi:hypothetical protein